VDSDPDLGGHKLPTKIEKKLINFIFDVLEVLYLGLKAAPLALTSFM
jgi:hypothetical protein